MFKRAISVMSDKKKMIMASSMAVIAGVLSFGNLVSAQVDPAVASTSELVVTTMKDNVTGVITANIANIVIVGVIIFSIGFTWKLARRFMK